MNKLKLIFSKQKNSLIFYIVISLMILFFASIIVLKVQNRVQRNQIIANSYKLALELSAKQPSISDLKQFKVKKFFILKSDKIFHRKLNFFEFLYGVDTTDSNLKFQGKLKDLKFKHIHDLASDSLLKDGPILEQNGTNDFTFVSPLGKNKIVVMVKTTETPYPKAPWGIIFIFFIIGFFIVLSGIKYNVISSTSLFVIISGFIISAFRLKQIFSFITIINQGFIGFTKGIFPWFWIILTIFSIISASLFEKGKISKYFSIIKKNRIAYSYVLPAMVGMLVLVLIPFAIGLGLGFFNHCNGRFQFIGLRNFVEILSGGGASVTNPLNFYFTLGVTLLWTSLNVFLHVSIGLGLALLLKDPLLKFKSVYRILLIIPWAMPNYITALMWKGMFQQQYGAINIILEKLGIGGISWFSSFWPAFMANVITNTWLGFPFMMVVSLGALQSIPSSLYEAAEVDGASKWQQFTNITLPLLKPALYPAIILGSIWTFNMFNVIYLVSGGEPGGATDILITEAYQWAFKRGERYGLAAAYAVLIFIILLIYSRVANKLSKAEETA